MLISLNVHWPDVDYFEVSLDFTPGYPATWDDPGDGPEISTENIVRVHYMSGLEDVITWDAFVLWYASEEGLTLDAADRKIVDKLTDLADEEWRDSYDGPDDGDAWSGGFTDNH